MNFLDLVKRRHSVRSYESRPIEQSKLDYIMECVRMALSAVNFQSWKFAIVTEKHKLDALKAVYPREWIRNVPCIIVACADHEVSWHRNSDGKDHADIDVAIAVEHLCLAATEQGLGTCWVCNFDTLLCKQVLTLSENLEPVVLIPIGYATSEEIPEKKRKSMEDIILV